MNGIQLDFCDVLIKPTFTALSSRSEVELLTEISFKHSKQKRVVVPVIAANLSTVGTMHVAKELQKYNCMTALHKHYSKDQLVQFFKNPANKYHTFYTMGVSKDDRDKFEDVQNILGFEIPNVCIDIANGYMNTFYTYLRDFRKVYPNTVLMAGNVVTSEAVSALDDSGVDIAKVGIGSGGLCVTRRVAGVGRPQLAAIQDCVSNAKISICSDGGCVYPGDVAKAFCAGSDFVMLGSMLAGHSDPEIDVNPNDGTVEVFGMSSDTAMQRYNGGKKRYRSSEGRTVSVPCRGPIVDTIEHILGGVRSAGTYVGAAHLKSFHTNSEFYQVNRQLNNYFE